MIYYIKRLLSHVKEYKLVSILTPVFIILEVLLEVSIPMLMGQMVDVGIATGDMDYVIRTGALMVLMAFGALIFGSLSAGFGSKAAMGFAKNLRMSLFEKIENFSFKNTDKFTTPSLVTRLTQDITYLQQAYMMSLRMMMRSPTMLVTATIMAIGISGELSLILLLAIPLLAGSLAIIATKTYPRFIEMLKRYDALNASAQENLIAIRVVKAFVRRDYERKKFNESAEGVRKAQLRAEKILILNSPIMQLVMYGCIVAVALIGGGKIAVGGMESGALMSFFSYITSVLMSLMMLSMVFINMVLSAASAKRVVEVLDEVPAIDENLDSKFEVQDGSVVFSNVSFSYTDDPNNLTLTNIDLQVKSGETIGIIGGSGSGKTSLVQLIPRLYDVYSGAVLVGGHDVREYSTETLRECIGMVMQKNVLFSGTIRENLLWGNPNASQEEIEEATAAACAHDFIMSFEKGYETDLGQGGVNVSGGQKQRLCIARALLKKPKILILDDSTSAVDTATDASILEAFRTKFAGVTKFIIAQRIHSVMDADRIIVMNEGGIDAIGTHEELLKSNLIYQEVYHSQQKGVA
ncbi:MAG: ABC transporter ATP-binding protein [Clostridia bacterium]|nr:ABC transporter ATP-binding protein [Clostridia bacterium]